MSSPEIIFDAVTATHINHARLEHLASLGLPLTKRTVLEVGAGVGWLTGFFEERACTIVSTDGRPENVQTNRSRNPDRKAYIADLSIPGSHDDLPVYDIVFCYGTLYHLDNPAGALVDLSKRCGELFLLESCVNPIDNGEINPVMEPKAHRDQSLHGIGCRPSRNWIMSELRKSFPFVYTTVMQPDHPDYPFVWPVPLDNQGLSRAVFVASRQPLFLPTLTEILPVAQSRFKAAPRQTIQNDLYKADATGIKQGQFQEKPLRDADNEKLLDALTGLGERYQDALATLNFEIMREFDLVSGQPWATLAASEHTNYYGCLYLLSKAFNPRRILEIGTAFGMSGATLIKSAVDLKRFISLDLGIFSDQHNFDVQNIAYAQSKVHTWCVNNGIGLDLVRFFQVNTQPEGLTDNTNVFCVTPHYSMVQELSALLAQDQFDVLFVDGKHTEWGLYNDIVNFWKYLRPGGILICDDLHDPLMYKQHFAWAGDTLLSFNRAVKELSMDIIDYKVWNFPRIGTNGPTGLRPFGLIYKR